MPDSFCQMNLASTAHWTASVRALESARTDRLFADPWATALAGEEGQRWLDQRPPDSVLPIVLRTRYFDDCLQRMTRETAIRQVVLLAAGLDTRAYRLAWPEGTHLFELDQPDVLESKENVLQAAGALPACERHALPVDLNGPWQERLVTAGFNPGQPSAWLLEGFLFYLPTENGLRLLDDLSRMAAPGSWLGLDVINSAMLTSPLTRQWVEMQASSGAPWIGILDAPREYLGERSWQVSLTQAGQPEANHGRWRLPVLPSDLPGVPHNWFVTADKK